MTPLQVLLSLSLFLPPFSLRPFSGLLRLAQRKLNVEIKISWWEKLQKWIKTLAIYEELQKERPNDVELWLGYGSRPLYGDKQMSC